MRRRRREQAARAFDRIEAAVAFGAGAVAGQVDEVQAEAALQAFDQRREDAGMHRPAVDQDEVRAVAERLNVH